MHPEKVDEICNKPKLIKQNNQALSAVTLSATLEALRRYPDSQMLFFDIVTPPIQCKHICSPTLDGIPYSSIIAVNATSSE